MASLDKDVKDIKNSVGGTGASSPQMQGAAASGAAAAGNPVLVGGRADTTTPSSVDDGDAVEFFVDTEGRVYVRSQGVAASGAAASGAPVLMGGRYDSTTATAVDDGDVVEVFVDSVGRVHVIDDGAANPSDDVISVLERQTSVSPTIVISASPDYSIADVVGGIITLSTVNYASGKGVCLDKLILCEDTGQVPDLQLLFFKATPAAGTYTDNAALVWGAGDLANLVASVSIGTGDWVVTVVKSVVTLADLNLPMSVTGTDLFLLIIAKSTYNAAATDDLLLTATFKQRF